jgi:hypothetical protein
MNKMKSLLLSFVKPLVLAHLSDLGILAPMLSKVIVDKTHAPQEQADSLAKALVAVVENELALLVNKL